jgi:catechol 2,3-dioxygenase-like lactoylglutathione lyase family enzyme
MNDRAIHEVLCAFEAGRINRRDLLRAITLGIGAAAVGGRAAPAAAEGGLTIVSVDHISYRVSDYTRTRDFYAGLFGLHVTDDTGTQCELRFGNSMITARNPRQSGQATPNVDHVAYTIGNWDTDAVKNELTKRGLEPRLDLGDASSPPNYVSFHIRDPDGYDVQISGVAVPGDSQYRTK